MKPIISKSELATINGLIEAQPKGEGTREIEQLRKELARATIVEDSEITDDVIQIGSSCTIEETRSKSKMELMVTLPENADMKQKKHSVLSPLGVAIIGFKEGLEFEWQMPGGLRTFRVISVSKAK